MKELYDAIEKAGIDLAKAKEGFIIEEIAPYFNDIDLIQKLKVRLIEVEDIKKHYNDKIVEFYSTLSKKKFSNGCKCSNCKEFRSDEVVDWDDVEKLATTIFSSALCVEDVE